MLICMWKQLEDAGDRYRQNDSPTSLIKRKKKWWHVKKNVRKSLNCKDESVRTSADVFLSVSLKTTSVSPCVILISEQTASAEEMLMNSVRDDFHAVFLIIIFKGEQKRNGLDLLLPLGISTFNYHQQMAFGWMDEERPDGLTPRKHYGQRVKTGKEATESGDYRW